MFTKVKHNKTLVTGWFSEVKILNKWETPFHFYCAINKQYFTTHNTALQHNITLFYELKNV